MTHLKLGYWAGSAVSACTMILASGAATAQEAEEQDVRKLEIVTVTAAKREQTLQDVSAAVSVVSPELIASAQIDTLEDLQVVIPGLTIGNDFAFAKIFVRGIGMNSSFPGMDPSVALHVDGAVVSQASQQFASLYDLERVEVIRGPQGTLYGRNATGGSVNLISAKPTDELEGYTRFTIGGPELNIITENALSGPLTDSIQGRVALRYQNREGYGTHTLTGEDIDDANKLGIRGQLNFDLTDRVSNLVMVEYYQEDEKSKAVKFLRDTFTADQVEAIRATGLYSNAAVDSLLGRAGPDARANSRDIGGDHVPIGDLETFSVTNTLDIDINDLMNFRSVTNYREGLSTLLQDFDISNRINGVEQVIVNGVPTVFPSTNQYQRVENQQLSQELQLLFDASRWRGIVGAYYFEDTIQSDILIGTDPRAAYVNGVYPAVPRARVVIPATMDVEAYAAFVNFTYDLTDVFRLKLGARYSEEERTVTNSFFNGAANPFNDVVRVRSYSDFSPEVGLEYDIGDSMLFATFSEGFKSGTAALGDTSPDLINPETIENWEVGIKGIYLDGALNLSAAAFMYTVTDAQFDRTIAIPTPPFFTTSVENAAETEGEGIEIEGSWLATENLRLDFNGTLYDIAFNEFSTLNVLDPLVILDGTAAVPDDLAGNRPRNTPDYSFGLRGTYTQDLANGGMIDYSVAYAYKGEQFYTEFNDPLMGADAYGILDANLTYTFPNEDLTLNLWAKNITDEFVLSGAFAISTSRTTTGTYLPPRSYGITIGYAF
jgi:iron complex outermembrane receptor protein